jgi:predicted hydrocarbon binding protein
VTTSQLANVYAVVHRHLGETLTRLFLTNYGNKMGPMLVDHPTVKSLAQKSKAIPAAGRAAWAIQETCGFLNTIWANVQVREDPQAWYLEVDHCPICAGIRGATAPICASSEIIYTVILRAVGGQWPTFKEVACRAQGNPVCSYRLAK